MRHARVALLFAGFLAAPGATRADDGVIVLDVTPGADSSNPDAAVVVGDVAYYPVWPQGGAHLVRTDGHTAAVLEGHGMPEALVARGPDLWFRERAFLAMPELACVLGGGTEIRTVAGAAQGFASVAAGPFVLGDHVLFFADGGTAGYEPWAADAASLATTRLASAAAHPHALLQAPFTAAAGRAVFWVYDPPLAWVPPTFPNPEPNDPSGGTLTAWVTDGTPEGTYAFASETVTSYRDDLLVARGSAAALAWFTRTDAAGRTALWRTDGTPGGTFAVTDPAEDVGFDQVSEVGGRAAFLRVTRAMSITLWTSDGTREGTAALAGAPQLPPSFPTAAVSGDRLFLTTADTVWSSALTAQPQPVGLSAAGPPSRPSGLSVVDGRVLFVASDPVHGPAVWTADGTAYGTRRLRDGLVLEVPSLDETFTRGFTAVGDRIVFTAWDAANGWEMRSFPRAWVADPLPPLTPDDTTGPTGDPPVVLPDVEPFGRILELRAFAGLRDHVQVLTIRGAVRVARGTSLVGQRVIVGAGDYVGAFTADASGTTPDARGSFRVVGTPRPGRTVRFVATIRGPDAAQALAGGGRKIRVSLFFADALRTAAVRVSPMRALAQGFTGAPRNTQLPR